MDVSTWLQVAQIVEAIATVTGLGVAAYWTYKRFVQHREPYPSASLEHSVDILEICAESLLLQVRVHVKNTGRILLPVQDLECRLLQVLPLVGSPGRRFANGDSLVEDGDKEVKWPSLGVRKWECDSGVMEIEPGESETFQVDYHVPASLEVVRLYSHLNNTTKKTKIGWAHSMNIDLRRRDT